MAPRTTLIEARAVNRLDIKVSTGQGASLQKTLQPYLILSVRRVWTLAMLLWRVVQIGCPQSLIT